MTYKKYIIRHAHPLAKGKGRVRLSRYVLYNKLDGNPGHCNWCKEELSWDTLCADHLDSDTMNDVPENLVGSCRGCNANREDGTGHGRQQPKTCPECDGEFIGGSHHKTQTYCSLECARKNHPKTGTKAQHGERSRYVYGCRCELCKKVNTEYWRDNYSAGVKKK